RTERARHGGAFVFYTRRFHSRVISRALSVVRRLLSGQRTAGQPRRATWLLVVYLRYSEPPSCNFGGGCALRSPGGVPSPCRSWRSAISAIPFSATRPSNAAGSKLLAIPLGIAAVAATVSLSITLRSYSLVFLAQFSFFCALAVYTLRFSRPRCGSVKGAPTQAGGGESR